MKNLCKNSYTEESISLVVQERVTCLREGLENIQHCSEVVMSFPGPACSTHLGVITHASAWSFLQQVLQGSVFLELCQKKALIHILTTISKSNRAFSCCSLLFGWLQPINWSYIIYYNYLFPALVERVQGAQGLPLPKAASGPSCLSAAHGSISYKFIKFPFQPISTLHLHNVFPYCLGLSDNFVNCPLYHMI